MASLSVKSDNTRLVRLAHVPFALVLAVALLSGCWLIAQELGDLALENPTVEKVVQVRIVGNQAVAIEKIQRSIHTRSGRPFDMETVEEDVRRLTRTRLFVDVKPSHQRVAGGRIVIFEVIERPTLLQVKYIGNRSISKEALLRESELTLDEALDPAEVEGVCSKLEAYYRTRGFSKVHVSVVEGNKSGDREAVYLINEGPRQKISWVSFVGNHIASDSRLRTQILSKRPTAYLYKGEYDAEVIEEDKNRLVAYYRRLGFFQARVGCEPKPSAGGGWVHLTFVVDEGVRSYVRKVSFSGNTRFDSKELAELVTLKDGQFYNGDSMKKDLDIIQDKYGCIGYVFSTVEAAPRFLEEPGQLDLVYDIHEGYRYHVGRISVEIKGEDPHTRVSTVLDRISLQTGDIVDLRKLRASERRLIRSGLFEVNRPDARPEIRFTKPHYNDEETAVAGRPGGGPTFRGQSPDLVPSGPWKLVPSAGSRPGDRRVDLVLPCRRVDSKTIWRGQDGYNSDGGWSTPPLPPSRPTPGYQPPSGTQPSPFQPRGTANSAPGGTYSGYPNRPNVPDVSRGYPAPMSPADAPIRAPLGAPYGNQPNFPDLRPADPQPSGLPELFEEDSIFRQGRQEEPPTRALDIRSILYETQTGRFMAGVGVNSDAGLMGSIVIDERNFDWARWPGTWNEFRDDPGGWGRGGGQRLRLEAVPGTLVQRYMINFSDDYLFHSRISGNFSAFFFNRRYREYDEERVGGRIGFGYQFPGRPDLTANFAIRAEKISIYNPAIPGVAELEEVLGDNSLYGFQFSMKHDTRDNQFMATEGYLLEAAFEQVVGSFNYPRAEVDLRKYYRIHERPDGSGRHVLSLNGRVSVSGANTPIYDHYFIGGFSTMRGFDFRGASPMDATNRMRIGGHFQMLAGIQYNFPVTADDMLRVVVFCDTGTVEPTIDNWTDKYRVAPGFGLRITVPAMGPAPIALDFAFPISSEAFDREEMFSFFVGLNR